MHKLREEAREIASAEIQYDHIWEHKREERDRRFIVVKEGEGVFRVTGGQVERMVVQTDWEKRRGHHLPAASHETARRRRGASARGRRRRRRDPHRGPLFRVRVADRTRRRVPGTRLIGGLRDDARERITSLGGEDRLVDSHHLGELHRLRLPRRPRRADRGCPRCRMAAGHRDLRRHRVRPRRPLGIAKAAFRHAEPAGGGVGRARRAVGGLRQRLLRRTA